jgi:hypothetical protein
MDRVVARGMAPKFGIRVGNPRLFAKKLAFRRGPLNFLG